MLELLVVAARVVGVAAHIKKAVDNTRAKKGDK